MKLCAVKVVKAVFIYNAQKCVFFANHVTATNTGILRIAFFAIFRAVFASATFVYLLWKMNASLKVRIYSPLSISCTSPVANQLHCEGFAELQNCDGLVLACLGLSLVVDRIPHQNYSI